MLGQVKPAADRVVRREEMVVCVCDAVYLMVYTPIDFEIST